MEGKKTITSAAIVAIVAVLQFMKIIDDGTAKLLFELATACGLYGVYDRINRP